MTAQVSTLDATALFASGLQPSDRPSARQVRAAISTTVAQLGPSGCAACLAYACGDHPDEAAVRMRWARALVAVELEGAARAAAGQPQGADA
jgi:hypothetical protein